MGFAAADLACGKAREMQKEKGTLSQRSLFQRIAAARGCNVYNLSDIPP
jgi:hypothetical protein